MAEPNHERWHERSWPVGDEPGRLAKLIVETVERGLDIRFRPFQLGGLVVELSDGEGSVSRAVDEQALRLIRDVEGMLLHTLRRNIGDMPEREPTP